MPAILWAHVTSDQDGGSTADGSQSHTTRWQIYAEAVNTSPADILAASLIPAEGEAFKRYKLVDPDLPASFNNSYVTDGTVNDNLRVVDRKLTQSKEHPNVYSLTVTYGGKTDPLFELPKVEWIYDEYQEFTNYDVNGRLVENSALDPISGGMPIDGGISGVKITRPLAWASWNALAAEPYLRTLNAKPFVLSRQFIGANPIVIPPGKARIKSILPQEVVRAKGQTPATSVYYWLVTATIMFDDKTFPLRNGSREEHRHRYVVADRGFNKFAFGKRTPIYLAGGEKPTEEQFLRDGIPLALPSNSPPVPPTIAFDLTKIWTTHDYYSASTSTLLTVAAPGVLGNDQVLAGINAVLDTSPTHSASFALNSNGSFTYTSDPGFVGWDSFTYHAEAPALDDSPSTTVLIRVGPQPDFLAFDRYRYLDWSPIAALLEGW